MRVWGVLYIHIYSNIYILKYIWPNVDMYVYTFICIRTYIRIRIRIRIRTYIYIPQTVSARLKTISYWCVSCSIYTYIYKHMYAYIYMYTLKYICMRTYTQIHTHILYTHTCIYMLQTVSSRIKTISSSSIEMKPINSKYQIS